MLATNTPNTVFFYTLPEHRTSVEFIYKVISFTVLFCFYETSAALTDGHSGRTGGIKCKSRIESIELKEAFTKYVSWNGLAMRGYLLHLHTDVLLFSFSFASLLQLRFDKFSVLCDADGTKYLLGGLGLIEGSPLLWGDEEGLFFCTCWK
jgi:hypothetical protein